MLIDAKGSYRLILLLFDLCDALGGEVFFLFLDLDLACFDIYSSVSLRQGLLFGVFINCFIFS